MIENKIYSITADELDRIRQEANTTDAHFVEIQGSEIQSWDEYLDKIEVAFQFPNEWRVNISGYCDWMKDLDWLGKESYVLIIYDYSKFMAQDLKCKELIMEIFSDEILPWWQSIDEEKLFNGWAVKSFNVYLVNARESVL